MTRPGDPDATMPVPTGGEPTLPAESYPGAADPTQYGGGGGGEQFTGGPGGPDDEDDNRRKLWMIAGGVLLLGLLVGALIAVLAGGGGDDETTTTSSSTSSSTTSSTSTSTSTTTTPTTAPPQNPSIVAFTVNQNPVQCPSDMSTQNIILNWSTQNAQSVTISIDNPNGPYGTYPPSGQQAVPFACSESQHTYYLVANGSGNQHSNQKQINVNRDLAPTTTTS